MLDDKAKALNFQFTRALQNDISVDVMASSVRFLIETLQFILKNFFQFFPLARFGRGK